MAWSGTKDAKIQRMEPRPPGVTAPVTPVEVETSLTDLKRRVYLAGYTVAGLAAGTAWRWNRPGGAAEAFNLVTLPLLVFLFAALILLLLVRPASLRICERAAFFGTALYMLARLAHALFVVGWDTPVTIAIASFSHWMPAVMMLAFLVWPVRQAFVASSIYYVMTLLMVGGYLLFQRQSTLSLNVLLQQFVFANGVYLVLFYVLATARERYARFEAIAEWWNQLAHTDELTGVSNRRQLYADLKRELTRAQRSGRPFSLILFDIDHFKDVNDTHGHAAGDEVLKSISHVTRAQLRQNDLLGRWGGEEFLILAVDADSAEAGTLAERLRRSIEQSTLGPVSRVTASFGVATFCPQDSEDDLIRRTDAALYKAKEGGRNRVVVAPSPAEPARTVHG